MTPTFKQMSSCLYVSVREPRGLDTYAYAYGQRPTAQSHALGRPRGRHFDLCLLTAATAIPSHLSRRRTSPTPGLLFSTFHLVLHVSRPSEQWSIRVNCLLISDRVTNKKSEPRDFPTDKHLRLSSFNLEHAHVARPTPRLGGRRVPHCCTRTSPLQGRWSVRTLSHQEVYH